MVKFSEHFYKIQNTCVISDIVLLALFTGSYSASWADELPWWIKIGFISPWVDISHWFFLALTLLLWLFYLLEWSLQSDNTKASFSAKMYFILTSIVSWGVRRVLTISQKGGAKLCP